MHMLNLKRVAIVFCFILVLPFILIVSSVYLLDVDDYSGWIAKQIQQTTGYDVRFDHFESHWLEDKRFSLAGVSLYQQQQRVLYVSQLDITIASLDLWQRELVVNSIILTGVDVDIQQAVNHEKVSMAAPLEVTNKLPLSNDLAWKTLTVNKLEIIELNAGLESDDRSLLLEEANIVANDLRIIEHSKIKTLPDNLNFSTEFKELHINQQHQKMSFNHVQLFATADLLTQQGELNLSTGKVQIEIEGQPDLGFQSVDFQSVDFQSVDFQSVDFQSVDMQLQLAHNKLSLQHLFVNAFSGSLSAQADAYFALNLLPTPSIKVKRVELLSLLAENMQLTIPPLVASDNVSADMPKSDQLPIGELWVNIIDLKNMSVRSETMQLPLTLLSADAQISNVHVIQDARLLDPTEQLSQTGKFALTFDYLRWHDTVIEQFSIAGDLNKDDQGLHALKQLVAE